MVLRPDLALIADWIAPGSRVLDVGCGDGALLAALRAEKQVDGRGLELSATKVSAALARGLAVVQGDADVDLADYPDSAFDVVVLSQTLQTLRAPQEVLQHLLRIGRRAIVSFPNFGHWRVRLALALGGRMPLTPLLPVPWYATANIHLCTLADFEALCVEMDFACVRAVYRSTTLVSGQRWGANLWAQQAIIMLQAPD